MKVSLHVCYFNGESFTFAIHECGCDDKVGHPDAMKTEAVQPRWGRIDTRIYIGSLEDRAAAALEELDEVKLASYKNGMLLVIVQAGVDSAELEQRITAVLMAVSQPEHTLDALLRAGAESFNRLPVSRLQHDKLENFEDRLYNPRKDSWDFDDRYFLGRRSKGPESQY